jgi:hypothetical protein
MHWARYRSGPRNGIGLLKVVLLGSLTYFVAKQIFQ